MSLRDRPGPSIGVPRQDATARGATWGLPVRPSAATNRWPATEREGSANARVLRCATAGAAAIALSAAAASEAREPTDGAYGRLEGDLSFAVELGALEQFPGEALCARVSSDFLHTVGLYAFYAESFDVGSPPVARSTASGLEVRPLFLPRFTADADRGPAALDLWLDSFALNVGLFASEAPERSCATGGLECWSTGIELGASMELPLTATIDGPFVSLRGFARWPARPSVDAGAAVDAVHGGLSLSLGYRLVVDSALVEAGDPTH